MKSKALNILKVYLHWCKLTGVFIMIPLSSGITCLTALLNGKQIPYYIWLVFLPLLILFLFPKIIFYTRKYQIKKDIEDGFWNGMDKSEIIKIFEKTNNSILSDSMYKSDLIKLNEYAKRILNEKENK